MSVPHALAVMGPSGSGKSMLLIIAGSLAAVPTADLIVILARQPLE